MIQPNVKCICFAKMKRLWFVYACMVLDFHYVFIVIKVFRACVVNLVACGTRLKIQMRFVVISRV